MRMLLWQKNSRFIQFLLKGASKSLFFRFDVEIRFWSWKSLQFVEPAQFYCVWQLIVCRSEWGGCVKVPCCRSCMYVILLLLVCFSASSYINRIVVAARELRILANLLDFGTINFSVRIPFKKRFKSSFFRFDAEIRFCSFALKS